MAGGDCRRTTQPEVLQGWKKDTTWHEGLSTLWTPDQRLASTKNVDAVLSYYHSFGAVALEVKG
jgi:hypothetical protein